MATKTKTNSITPELIDRVGFLRAQAAELKKELDVAEAFIKAAGPGRYEGTLFSASVSTSERRLVDWASVAAKLEPSTQLVTAHTRYSESTSLRLSSRVKTARAA